MPPEWRGTRFTESADFPILVKFIFPNDKLSIQVHPDDAYAAAQEKAPKKPQHVAATVKSAHRQRGDAADTRVEALRDALDDAAFAGGVTPLENDDHLEFFVKQPILQLHQLALQPEKLLEVDAPIERSGLRVL